MSFKPVSPDAPAPDALPYNRISRPLDRLLVAIGQASAWLWLAVLLVVLANVFSRFALSRGSIALEELSWHLFGAALMLALAYAVVRDDHVRVDVLRERFNARLQQFRDDGRYQQYFDALQAGHYQPVPEDAAP